MLVSEPNTCPQIEHLIILGARNPNEHFVTEVVLAQKIGGLVTHRSIEPGVISHIGPK